MKSILFSCKKLNILTKGYSLTIISNIKGDEKMAECNHNCSSCNADCKERDLSVKPHRKSSIKKVIAVASGKGGVGKSFVTSMLAVSLQRKGYKSAILDADITGPSIPKIFGVKDHAVGNDEGLFPTLTSTGIKIMSSNLLLKNPTDPIIWRGPVISNLLNQFWSEVIWEDVDYLFVDMPPGTGDVPLTVFQSMSVDGIIIVTSPQELVSMIVSKAVNMAKMMNIPVIGIIENMSYLECPDCGKKIKLFGESNVDKVAKDFDLSVLAKLPLDPKATALVDKGLIEEVQMKDLDITINILENLPLDLTTIAVPVNDKKVSEHLGKTKTFNLYQIVKKMVINGLRLTLGENDKLVDVLKEHHVNTLLTPKVGEGLIKQLTSQGIEVVTGEMDDPLLAVDKYLSHEFTNINKANCHEGGHECNCDENSCHCK